MAKDTVAWLRGHFPDLANIQPLSVGGQKHVFSADHPADGPVVMKILRPDQEVESARREILAVQKIASSRVPRILEAGQLSDGMHDYIWFREQRISGQVLRECILRRPLAPEVTIKMGVHILEAAEAAERCKIVHRDIKPDNIMKCQNDTFWLLDFGLARHLTLQSMTDSAMPFGKATWGYAPLEQCRNEKDEIDCRTDLFALGVTMYECLTASNPYSAGARDHIEILRRLDQVRLPLLVVPTAWGSELADLVASMTQKRKDQRPGSCSEALDWLREIADKAGVRY